MPFIPVCPLPPVWPDSARPPFAESTRFFLAGTSSLCGGSWRDVNPSVRTVIPSSVMDDSERSTAKNPAGAPGVARGAPAPGRPSLDSPS